MMAPMTDPFDRSFRDRTLAGETLFGLFLDLGSAASAEVCGAVGYDWLLVDLEHGAGSEAHEEQHRGRIGAVTTLDRGALGGLRVRFDLPYHE